MPFKPGQSGNPKGRPVGSHLFDIGKIAREHAPAAIQTLVDCLRDDRHKVAAAIALLDRGFGKPAHMILGDQDQPVAIRFEWAPPQPKATIVEALADGDDAAVPTVIHWQEPN